MKRLFVASEQAMNSLMDKPITWLENRKTFVEFGNGVPVNYINENQYNLSPSEYRARQNASMEV